MPQVLLRAFFLLRRPAVVLCALGAAGGCSALVLLPLFGVPGYELGAAVSIACALLGGVAGIAAARQERRLIQGRDPRPRNALRFDSALRSAWSASGAACCLALFAAAIPLVASVAYAVAGTRCDPFAQLTFYPVLVIPTCALAAAAGTLCGFWASGWRRAFGLYLALVLVSACVTVWPLYAGPQVYAYNAFGGFFPGPLYDEALRVHPPLLWFRLETLLLALACVAWSAWCLDMREGVLRWPAMRPSAILLALGLVAAIVSLEDRAPELGTRMTASGLKERLGGMRESPHFRLYYARGKAKEEVDRVVRDLEFRYDQLTAFLGGGPSDRVNVYLYRSPSEKAAWVGAFTTQFAKPWRLELHINDGGFPLPTVKHELVHVLAERWGVGPFRVTSRFGVVPEMAIIEGLAVAADNPLNELTLHEWAAGMRREHLAPDLVRLFAPAGFYASAAPRAYTYAGSFLRYLADTYGAAKLQTLYAHGDFDASYGRSLSALAQEWERFLDGLPLDRSAANAAHARFHQGSIFARACAREVAELSAQAAEELPSDPEHAFALYRRCAALQPEEPSFALGESEALIALGRKAEAWQSLEALTQRVGDVPALLAEARLAEADLAVKMERPDDARKALMSVLDLSANGAVDRTARVKLAALASPTVGRVLWSYFSPSADDVKLLVLRDALASEPDNPYVLYLLGRRLAQSGAPQLASGYLGKALASPTLPEALAQEAWRLKVQAEFLSGDCDGVRNDVGHAPDRGAAFKGTLREWADRCAFEAKAFQGPLVPPGPFR